MSNLSDMQDKDNEKYYKYFSDCRTEESHSISIPSLRELCFNITNTFYAHESILRGTCPSDYNIQDEWHKYFRCYVSSYLLDLAVGIRTLMDKLGDRFPTVSPEEIDSVWGLADGVKQRTLREICNKIIHAQAISYALAKLDEEVLPEDLDEDDYFPQPTRCLSGEIELKGDKQNDKWIVSIYIQPLADIIFDLLSRCEEVIENS